MATPIRIKRSAVPGKQPTVDQVQLGELALNTYDAELYTKRVRSGIGTDIVRVGAGATVTNILYVTKDGSDTNTGQKLGDAKATISGAVAASSTGTVIRVSAGTYIENNPVVIPEQVSIVGEYERSISTSVVLKFFSMLRMEIISQRCLSRDQLIRERQISHLILIK